MADATQYLQDEIKLLKKGGFKMAYYFTEDDEITRVDTTGWTMFVELTKDGTLVDTWSIASGQIEHTPAQGQFNLSLTDEDVAGYKFSICEYRMYVDYGDDYPQVFEIGTVRIL